ncbi:hypothetical protein DIPPA_14565 [Diplonema papillatum]|nr:hypothetical protein DIPPA_14565 [Diplonema papillatum]
MATRVEASRLTVVLQAKGKPDCECAGSVPFGTASSPTLSCGSTSTPTGSPEAPVFDVRRTFSVDLTIADKEAAPAPYGRKRAATMPVMTRRKLKNVNLSVAVLPLAPETLATPASPPASAARKPKWQPRRKMVPELPPAPLAHVRFTPSGSTYDSFEEYTAATTALRAKIRAQGVTFGKLLTTGCRSLPLVAGGASAVAFTFDC